MKLFPLLAFTAFAFLTPTAPAAPQTVDELVQLISPTEEESVWLQIPWETDLTVARQKAVAENKPIFLWEMDGHPLGCV